MRSYDVSIVTEASETFLKENASTVNPQEWLDNKDNVLLVNDNGDAALFERGIAGVYSGHYLFKSRGKEAIKAGKAFLDEIFNSGYNIQVITGFTPITKQGARWMSRRLGFKSYGVQYVNDKPYEMFILTKKEFNNE